MEQTKPNGTTQPAALPAGEPAMRVVLFDQHQRATVERAYLAYANVLGIVAGCMGLGACELNEDRTGFKVRE